MKTLYEDYKEWCEETGSKWLGLRKFSSELQAATDREVKRSNSGKFLPHSILNSKLE